MTSKWQWKDVLIPSSWVLIGRFFGSLLNALLFGYKNVLMTLPICYILYIFGAIIIEKKVNK